MSSINLNGQVALVTGGSRGIGKAIALALGATGAKVMVNYHSQGEAADEVVNLIQEGGGSARAIQADVSSEEAVNRLLEDCDAIDILINNAGINISKPFAELTADDFNRTIRNNLTSAFMLTSAVLPKMIRKQYGRIINISSVAAQTGGVIGPHYAASKAGLLGLTHSYASILAPHKNITVNAIAPALIETDMIKDNPKIKPELIPIGRFGKAGEIADIVLMLVNNGYITGQTINANGGMYMS